MGGESLTGSVLLDEFEAIHLPGEESLLEGEAAKIHQRKNSGPLWKKLDEVQRDDERLKLYYDKVSRVGTPGGQAAICLSGGGIRSAAFALGILQGLARHGLLSRFHYISTVSGGGYIGGWLVAWACRVSKRENSVPFTEVEKELAAAGPKLRPLGELRGNQAFLTPQTGLMSPDTWGALAHVVRNLLLNWLVFLPLLASLLLLPCIVQAFFQRWSLIAPDGSPPAPYSSLVALLSAVTQVFRPGLGEWGSLPPPTLYYWLDSIGALCVALGLCKSALNRPSSARNAIDDAKFFRWVIAPVMAGVVCLLLSVCFWFRSYPSLAPDGAMLWQWAALCAFAFFAIRISVWPIDWVMRNLSKAPKPEINSLKPKFWEIAAQVVSGASVGAFIWLGIWLWHGHLPHDRDVATPTYLRDAVVFGPPWFLMSFIMGQVLLSGLTSRLFRKEGDRNREWLARASGWYAATALGWLAFTAVVLFGYGFFKNLQPGGRYFLELATAGSGLLTLCGGASPLTKAMSMATRSNRLRPTAVVTALSVVFALCLAVWVAHGTDLVIAKLAATFPSAIQRLVGSVGWPSLPDAPTAAATSRLAWAIGLAALLFALSAVISFFVNVNYFSLNALYRNRLIRAFLGASNVAGVVEDEPLRNPFDGSAPSDNLPMHEAWTRPAAGAADNGTMPFPVLNMTLNLTATNNKAWQERKAAPFVATPLKVGGDFVGYRPAESYAEGLTLGTCMSISGAAASPNWGYHSSPFTSFLMAIFNVRLGCWLGNPKHPDRWKSDGPKLSLRLFMQEALGRTTADQPFVYLSDGGHFENLGLYEMVRRRCRTIVVSDAGADPEGTLEDLGNAVRKISIDLGVTIEFDQIDTRKRGPDLSNPGVYCAKGRITYPEGGPVGTLIYIKAGLYGDAPADVRAYAAANAKFPHDTTLNQWFTESQFESYRALGSHVVRMMTSPRDASGTMCPAPNPDPLDLEQFIGCVKSYLDGYAHRSDKPLPIRMVS